MARNAGTRVPNLHVRGRKSGEAGAEIDTFADINSRSQPPTCPSGRAQIRADGGVDANSRMRISVLEEDIDLGGASSVTSTNNLLPANSIILGIVCTPLIDFSTPTTYDLGDTSNNTRFGDNLANDVVSDGPAVAARHLALATLDFWQTSAAKVKVTPNAAGTGRLRVAVNYISFAGGLA